MARIVCVHGVGKQLLGEQSLLRDWWPALADGLTRAGADPVLAGDVAMAFYGTCFAHRHLERYGDQAGTMRGILDSPDGWNGTLARFVDLTS